MSRRSIRSRGQTVLIVRRGDPVPPEWERLRFDDLEAARAYLARHMPDPSDSQTLRGLAAELAHGVPARDELEAVAGVAAAVAAGRLLLVRERTRRQTQGYGRTGKDEQDEPEVFDAPRPETDWIEIKLVDEAGVGIPRQRYLIVTPDGQERRGYTDSLGLARVTRIVSGACEVSFPDLDARAWDRA